MSKGGFSVSAAHAGQPRRAMFLEHAQFQEGTCAADPIPCFGPYSLAGHDRAGSSP